jgi:hypothetical protein
VLKYYSETSNVSLGKWPTTEISWEDFDKKQKFYDFVTLWFATKNITIIHCNNTSRYLSSFILAAGFPPTMGFQRVVNDLVHAYSWFSLHRSAEPLLESFVDSADISSYTIAEQQLLKKGTQGYFALLDLMNILSSIRYLLGTCNGIEDTCTKVAGDAGWDIDLVQNIAHTYRETLIPEHEPGEKIPTPQFSYQLLKDRESWKLIINHNLHKPTRIQAPGSLELSRFSNATLTCLAGLQTINLGSSNSIQVENTLEHCKLESTFTTTSFDIPKLSKDLKEVQLLLTVSDLDAHYATIHIGGIHRNEDFLAFDLEGKEITANTLLFKRGQSLMLVPLTTKMMNALGESPYFSQLEYAGNIPIFGTEGTQPEIEIDGRILTFCTVPFSINLREQTAWEKTFKGSRNCFFYFYSPVLHITLEGDFSNIPEPTILLEKIFKIDTEIRKLAIKTKFEDGRIIPLPGIPSPGLYEITIQFGTDKPKNLRFSLLPIKKISLLNEKSILIKLYSTSDYFTLAENSGCEVLLKEDLVTLTFQEYGEHLIKAKFSYIGEQGKMGTTVQFIFEAKQEIVGQFSQKLKGTNNNLLSLTKDFIPSSYLEFRKSNLREESLRYSISMYREGELNSGIFPRLQSLTVDGKERFALASLVNQSTLAGYSRLLLLVHCDREELFRATFSDCLTNILDLEKEWENGRYSQLKALPLLSLKPELITNLEDLSDNSIVYGMIESSEGKPQLATHGQFFPGAIAGESDNVPRFLYSFTSFGSTRENQNLLLSILSSPEESYTLFEWFSKANKQENPYEIAPFTYLLDSYPIIAAWAELARNPENSNESFALITQKAKIRNSYNLFCLPRGAFLANHPRFSSELITVKDIETLESMGLMPTGKGPFFKNLGYFCMLPFVAGSKPILSWLTLFYFHSYAIKNNRQKDFSDFKTKNLEMSENSVLKVSNQYSDALPSYRRDVYREQDLRKIIIAEQEHYLFPPINRIEGLCKFLDALETLEFSMNLRKILERQPLLYAEPNILGFEKSTKWKCILFLSLYVVSLQIDNQCFSQKLKSLWTFSHEQYVYLIKWVNENNETARIYNAYYEYWMRLFWEDLHV